MDDKSFHRDDKDTFKILTENFGKELWKKATITLTFANKVEDPSGGDGEDYFLEGLANWREAIHSFLGNELKLEPELVQLPCQKCQLDICNGIDSRQNTFQLCLLISVV